MDRGIQSTSLSCSSVVVTFTVLIAEAYVDTGRSAIQFATNSNQESIGRNGPGPNSTKTAA